MTEEQHTALQDATRCLEVFWRRRTIRHFRPDPIPEEDVALMLRAAQRAPTDATAQMYTLIRVHDRHLRHRLAELAGNQEHIRQCAEFFIVCLDVYRLQRLVEHRGGTFGMGNRLALIFGTLDAALAAENLAVAAEMLGYGTCFIGGVQNAVDVIARLLRLPPGVLPICGLCVGVPDPAHIPERPRPRLPQSLVVHEDVYHDYTPEDLEAGYKAMAAISRSGDWYTVLARYFTVGGVMEKREPVMARAWAQQALAPQGDDEGQTEE